MKLETLFSNLESVRFAAYVNAASSHRIFKRALEESSEVQLLLAYLQQKTRDSAQIYDRLITLLKANDKPGDAHPYDATIAAYLFVLSKYDFCFAMGAAQSILRTPRLWWAKKLATDLQSMLEGVLLQSESETASDKVDFVAQVRETITPFAVLSIGKGSGDDEKTWISAHSCESLDLGSGAETGAILEEVKVP